MKVYLNEDILVDASDGRNYTLYVKQDVVKKATNKTVKEFILVGYFGSVKDAVLGALNKKVEVDNLNKDINIDEFVDKLNKAYASIVDNIPKLAAIQMNRDK